MPFTQNNRPGLAGSFGQGWNAVMNLYGKKLMAEREKRQEDQFNKQYAMQEKKYAEDAKLRNLQYKQAEQQLKILKYDAEFNDKLSSLDPESQDFKTNYKRLLQLYKPEKYMELMKTEQASLASAKAASEGRIQQAKLQRETTRISQERTEAMEETTVHFPDGRTVEVTRGPNNENLNKFLTENPTAKEGKPPSDTALTTLKLRKMADEGDPQAIRILESVEKHQMALAEARAFVKTPESVRIENSRKEAEKQLKSLGPTGEVLVTEDMARKATGPYANLAAFIDAFAGGVGIDALFGKEGFFNDIQEARQTVSNLKNSVLEALKFSRMGAGYDIKRITGQVPDPKTIFTNPANEARKLNTLRGYLKTVRRNNLQAIANSNTSAKDVGDLQESNRKISLILMQIGENASGGLSPEAQNFLKRKGYDYSQ